MEIEYFITLSIVQTFPALPVKDQYFPVVLYALMLALGNILQGEDQLILNDGDIIPKPFCERQWISVYVSNVCACGVNSQDVGLLLSQIGFVVASHHHDLVLSDLRGGIGTQRNQFVPLPL